MAELLIGCGNSRKKHLTTPGRLPTWTDLTTLDNDPDCGADVEHDLERLPYPFEAGRFDEVHGYHVLEHQGAQGDYRFFFAQFAELWRILKPGGVFCGIVPSVDSIWAWGDPGHRRVMPAAVFTFLDQSEYTKQVGVTAFADYRRFYRADFKPMAFERLGQDEFAFVLEAVKPSRISV